MLNITIIGGGRVGGALAIALERAGATVDAIVTRGSAHPQVADSFEIVDWTKSVSIASPVIIIATRDDDIAVTVGQIADRLTTGDRIVLHTSGSISSEILSPLRAYGCRVGSLHPLVSVSEPRIGAERFAESYFCLEGDADAVASAEAIVESLGGNFFSIPTAAKPLYHASAVTACGHLVALFDAALEMLTTCGPSREESKRVLLPLVSGTVANIARQDTPRALTGPFARADAGTVATHLESIAGLSPSAVNVYLALAERSIEIAVRGGADADRVKELEKMILFAKTSGGC